MHLILIVIAVDTNFCLSIIFFETENRSLNLSLNLTNTNFAPFGPILPHRDGGHVEDTSLHHVSLSH